MLFWFRILITSSSQTLLNALVKSIKQTNRGLLNSTIDFSITWRNMNIASTVDLLDLNPCCSSDIGTFSISLLAMILVNTLRTELSSVMFLKLFGLLFYPYFLYRYRFTAL